MANTLEGVRVAFLVANEGIERAELVEPWNAVRDAGATCVLAAPKTGAVQLFEHLDKADTRTADLATTDLDPAAFDALVLPGGVANADELRMDDAAVRFAAAMVRNGAPVGVICHGPWTLVEGGVLEGRTITSWPSLQTDIRNAGAQWVDEEVHVDGNLISSRKPADLPAFCREIIDRFARAPSR
jgi:protease I